MLAPTAITWHNTLADLNKQLGLQAQKNMVFLLCLLSLTKCVIDLASSLVYRQISVLDPMSSKIINVESNYELLKIEYLIPLIIGGTLKRIIVKEDEGNQRIITQIICH
ncbi:MAG: hypothetical protein EZS28_019212 [Streblomastix strix]|uniref:Uncharacterized protein n=1 Tax=Streblomastix strix TaxID=222440 RepID=A0A5J4VSG2_9EUKA|nr:MAG: hypothetical protein EZS28_019212 [Streblomastix strix]